jgi:hypothetical protein
MNRESPLFGGKGVIVDGSNTSGEYSTACIYGDKRVTPIRRNQTQTNPDSRQLAAVRLRFGVIECTLEHVPLEDRIVQRPIAST